MANYSKRAQTMLTEKQYKLLSELAEKEKKPVSVLIREAVEKVYFVDAEREKRLAALNDLLSMNAPVADWEQMEEEITRGMLDDRG